MAPTAHLTWELPGEACAVTSGLPRPAPGAGGGAAMAAAWKEAPEREAEEQAEGDGNLGGAERKGQGLFQSLSPVGRSVHSWRASAPSALLPLQIMGWLGQLPVSGTDLHPVARLGNDVPGPFPRQGNLRLREAAGVL